MGQTPDRFPGEREDEGVLLEPSAVVPTVNGELRYVTGVGFRFYEEGVLKGLGAGGDMPIATYPGQVILSVDGTSFSAQLPLTAPDWGSSGWLVNDSGLMLVVG